LTAGPIDDRMNLESRYNMDKDYIDKKIQSDSLVRIANALEEILRLVKKDMGEMKKAAK
jgi:hypothetical protein